MYIYILRHSIGCSTCTVTRHIHNTQGEIDDKTPGPEGSAEPMEDNGFVCLLAYDQFILPYIELSMLSSWPSQDEGGAPYASSEKTNITTTPSPSPNAALEDKVLLSMLMDKADNVATYTAQ